LKCAKRSFPSRPRRGGGLYHPGGAGYAQGGRAGVKKYGSQRPEKIFIHFASEKKKGAALQRGRELRRPFRPEGRDGLVVAGRKADILFNNLV